MIVTIKGHYCDQADIRVKFRPYQCGSYRFGSILRGNLSSSIFPQIFITFEIFIYYIYIINFNILKILIISSVNIYSKRLQGSWYSKCNEALETSAENPHSTMTSHYPDMGSASY